MPASTQVRGGANFHRQLFILMAVRVIEPLSITQLFAYINPMMSHILPPTTDPADIGKYSGLIEAAFATGTFLTMYQWGRLSDRVGRKPAILSGLTGIAVTTLAFGLSGNFYMAITARLLGGALCGNASVIRAALGEITPPEAESWVYPLYTIIWDMSIIVGPVLGATLSDPITQYPGTWISRVRLFQQHPFLLPCAVTATLCVAGVLVIWFFFEETYEISNTPDVVPDPTESSVLLPVPSQRSETMSTMALIAHPAVQQVLVAFFLMAVISLSFDAIFVLWSYSPKELYGIGINPGTIAQAFAFKGCLSIVIAFGIFPILQRRLGALALYNVLTPFWVISFTLPFIMNILVKSRTGWVEHGEMKKMWGLMVPLMFTYTVGDLAWASISMIANNAAAMSGSLGAVNGLALTCSSLGRAVGPALGGFLYSFSAKSQFPIVWIVFAGLSLLTCVQGWTLRLNRSDSELSDDTPKDSRSELGQAGYGAVNSGPIAKPSTGKDDTTLKSPVFTVHQAKTRAEWLECVAIRIEVFIDEQGYDMADEIDKYDEKDVSVHFILYAEQDGRKTPAGTVRMVKDSLKLGRLAVQKDYRGYGLGKVLVQALHDWVKAEGGHEVLRKRAGGDERSNVVTVKLESQIHAIKFYGKLGYQQQGDEFLCDGQPHVMMLQDFTIS